MRKKGHLQPKITRAIAAQQNLKLGMLAVQGRVVDDEADLHTLQHLRYTRKGCTESPCLCPDDDICVVGAGEGSAQAGPMARHLACCADPCRSTL